MSENDQSGRQLTLIDFFVQAYPALPFVYYLGGGFTWIGFFWIGLIGLTVLAPFVTAFVYYKFRFKPYFWRVPKEVREYGFDDCVGEITERGILFSNDDGRTSLLHVLEIEETEKGFRFRFPLFPHFIVQENEQDKTIYFPIWPMSSPIIWGRRRVNRG